MAPLIEPLQMTDVFASNRGGSDSVHNDSGLAPETVAQTRCCRLIGGSSRMSRPRRQWWPGDGDRPCRESAVSILGVRDGQGVGSWSATTATGVEVSRSSRRLSEFSRWPR